MIPAIKLVDVYQKGLPPVAGGALDQSHSFIELVQRLEYEEGLIKAEDNG